MNKFSNSIDCVNTYFNELFKSNLTDFLKKTESTIDTLRIKYCRNSGISNLNLCKKDGIIGVNEMFILLTKIKNSFSDKRPNPLPLNEYKNKGATAIIFHETCFSHGVILDTINHYKRVKSRQQTYENPDRLNVLLQPPFGILLNDYFLKNCKLVNNSCKATLSDILRVHEYGYVKDVKEKCEEMKLNNITTQRYDSDTYISQKTYEASLQAVGCVMEAVDKLASNNGEYKNAFVAVRPPGHHAGSSGKVKSGLENCHSSNGFCFFNNVCVAGAYAKYKYREKFKKIAIVDFDVHHGNGTEEIVRNLESNVNENIDIILPFSGINVTVQKPNCHPWLDDDDAKDVLFVSLQGYDIEDPREFYPSSGSSQHNTPKESDIYPGGILNVPIIHNKKFSYGYRNIFRLKVIPRLKKFKPDLIFISAGFDGHESEMINSGYVQLTDFDYRFITEEITEIANKYCDGRVISVLEGGYNINKGVVSSFAQSVMTHVKFLNIGLNKNIDFTEENQDDQKHIRKSQFLADLENFRRRQRKLSKSGQNENDIQDDELKNNEMKNENEEEYTHHYKKEINYDLDGEIEEKNPNLRNLAYDNSFDYKNNRSRIKKKKSTTKSFTNLNEYGNRNPYNMSDGSVKSLQNFDENVNERDSTNGTNEKVKKTHTQEFSHIFRQEKINQESLDINETENIYDKDNNVNDNNACNKNLEIENKNDMNIDNFFTDVAAANTSSQNVCSQNNLNEANINNKNEKIMPNENVNNIPNNDNNPNINIPPEDEYVDIEFTEDEVLR